MLPGTLLQTGLSSQLAAAAAWVFMKAWAKLLDSGPALFAFFIVFALVTIIRRQKMFSALAGRNVLFGVLRVAIAQDKLGAKNVFLLASVFFALVKKYYLVFKQNGIERDVFSTLADVFESCKAQGVQGPGGSRLHPPTRGR